MQFYINDINKHPLLAKVISARIELGNLDNSDFIDELMRQIQKKHAITEGSKDT